MTKEKWARRILFYFSIYYHSVINNLWIDEQSWQFIQVCFPQLYTFPWHTDWLPQTQPPPPGTRKCCRLKKKNTPSNLQFWVSPQDKGTTYMLLLPFSSPRVKLFCTSWEKSSLEKSFIAYRSAEGSGVDALIVLSLPSNVFQNDLKGFILFYAVKQILLHSWKFSKFS